MVDAADLFQHPGSQVRLSDLLKRVAAGPF